MTPKPQPRPAARAIRGLHLGVILAVTVVTVVAVTTSGALVFLAERDAPGTNITSYGDAVWWAMETVTTVGYGDHHPTTVAGKWVASFLMVTGLALVGVITATVVTWFFSELDLIREVRDIEVGERRTEAMLNEVLNELRALKERIDETGSDEERRGG